MKNNIAPTTSIGAVLHDSSLAHITYMEIEKTTVETQGEAPQLSTAPVETALKIESPVGMTLEELNSTLGKDFKDIPTALKSLKELNSFVGKKVEPSVPDSILNELKELKENQFYGQHPELKEHRALLAKLDKNPEVAFATPEFQAIFTKAKGFDESQKLKTVLESNPRIASSRDNLTKAKESMNAGDKNSAEEFALKAVKDTFEL